jgi:hypothetical protein
VFILAKSKRKPPKKKSVKKAFKQTKKNVIKAKNITAKVADKITGIWGY